MVEMMYVKRLPYRREKGCQKRSPQPRNRNMKPVPSLSVPIETPDALDSGTMTEYTVESEIPVNQVYLHDTSQLATALTLADWGDGAL